MRYLISFCDAQMNVLADETVEAETLLEALKDAVESVVWPDGAEYMDARREGVE